MKLNYLKKYKKADYVIMLILQKQNKLFLVN